MKLDIDQVINSVGLTRDAASVMLQAYQVDALLTEITDLRRAYDEASTNVWRLEDWLAYIVDHTSDPEVQFYCRHALDGDHLDVLNDAEEDEDSSEEATNAPLR